MISRLFILLVMIVLASEFSRAEDNDFMGAGACRTCHLDKTSGNQYTKWVESSHSNAYTTLTTEDSKKIAKAKGIDDPTKAAECLRCHVTAFQAKRDKRFNEQLGVQCEVCHGPAEKHVAARQEGPLGEDNPVELPKGEIVGQPDAESCRKCHNKDSPTYRPFSFAKFMPSISHMDPRKKRPADYYEKLPADPKDDPKAVAPKKKE